MQVICDRKSMKLWYITTKRVYCYWYCFNLICMRCNSVLFLIMRNISTHTLKMSSIFTNSAWITITSQNTTLAQDHIASVHAGCDTACVPSTVYSKKYAHGFVVLCFVEVMQSFIMNSHEVFIHIHQGCFAGTGAIVRLPQCQWSKPDGYGKISQCITTTKHSKEKTVCIFLGIYCTYRYMRSYWKGILGVMFANGIPSCTSCISLLILCIIL